MKKPLLLLTNLLVLWGIAAAQKTGALVQGTLVDTTAKQSLPGATVSIIRTADSSLVSYTVSNKQGGFELRDITPGSYRLIVSFLEYETFKKDFSITASQRLINFDQINMQKQYKTLSEVVVTDDVPIKIKGDTVEFKARAFKTKPNATVEDMLKKVPGLQVDKAGTVKSQGEQIQKVYVDGKEFFGNDPRLATKNLTADMVESVQVFDDMSDQAKFSKMDDGSKQKALNIKLKKDKRRGYFGRILAGAGNDNGRYETNLNLNHFNDGKQLSVLANINNINKQGFSFSDVVTAMGGPQNMGGGAGGSGFGGGGMQMFNMRAGNAGGLVGTISPSGISRSASAGINYNNYESPKLRIGANYFFSNTRNETLTDVFRQSFYQNDSTTELNEKYLSNGADQNNRFNIRLEYQLDSMNSILYIPSFTLQHSDNSGNDTSSTYSSTASQHYLSISGTTKNSSERNGETLNNNLLFRHRFGKIGRTLTIGLSNNYSHSNRDEYYISSNTFYIPDSTQDNSFDQNRNSLQETYSHNNVLSTSYTEPLGKDKLFELNYAYTSNKNISDKKTYDFDVTSGKYETIDLPLTNYFKNSFEANRIGINFRVQKKTYNYQLGTAAQFSTLESISHLATTGLDSTSRHSYRNFFPVAIFNYQVNRSKSFRFRYSGRTSQPGLMQLQNVLDQSNALQWRIGNPNLKQEFTHNVNVAYHTFNILNFKFIAANINLSTTSNKIVNSIDSVAKGIQLIKPVNLDGNFNSSGFITLGLPFKNKLEGSSLNFTNSIEYNRDVSLLYQQKNTANTITITQGAGLNFDLLQEKLDFGIDMNVSYYNVKYSVNTSLNENYFTQTYSADFSYTLPGNFILATDFDYYINSGRANGFNQSIPLWNAGLSKQVFKKKNGEIRFAINDILDQNQNINRTTLDNYIEDTRTNVLQRYFMISFLFNLNKMGGENINYRQTMPMPKMIERGTQNIRITH